MGVPYDAFIGAFLSKISEFELMKMDDETRRQLVEEYMKRAVSAFRKNCKYDLF